MRQGLLAEHVTAGVQGVDRRLLVQLVRRAHGNRVEVLLGEHFRPVGIHALDAEAFAVAQHACLGDIGHRDEFHVVALDEFGEVRAGDPARADEAVAELLVVLGHAALSSSGGLTKG